MELIRKQTVLNMLDDMQFERYHTHAELELMSRIYQTVNNLDSVDAVEVVRCKDCIHNQYGFCEKVNHNTGYVSTCADVLRAEKRKTNEQEGETMDDLIYRQDAIRAVTTDSVRQEKGDTIYRQDAIDALDITPLEVHDYELAVGVIKDVPSAQKKGHWNFVSFMTIECSECKIKAHELEYTNFCPNCGADMRG